LIVAIALDGRPLTGTIKHELVKPAPATALMVLTGTATALAYTEIGILALTLFAIAALIPQTLVLALLKPRPVSALERPAARAIYAQEIARTMGLGARKRLVLKDAALYMQEFPQRPPDGMLTDRSDRHRFDVIEAVLYGREHWGVSDRTPRPVSTETAPLASRILAVSDVWAALTAKGSPKLSHQRALDHVEARASLHFDAQVMEAARQLIAQERFGPSAEAVYRPRLERNSFPRLAGRLQASARPSV
jgi:hypothetical protein